MKEKIKKLCKGIEKEYDVRILFAVENGSRAWRMASRDSDYDVRFVFVRPVAEYLKIDKPIEVINKSFDKGLEPCQAKGALIDISGFDVFKFAKLLSSSNPTAIEWLVTDMVYYGRQNRVFRQFALKNFSKVSLYHHYKSLCRKNYEKYIKSSRNVTHKKYLYCFRGLVNAKLVAHKKKIPPISFREAIRLISTLMPLDVFRKLHEIVSLKSKGKEKDKVKRIKVFDKEIEAFLEDKAEEPVKEKKEVPKEILNTELARIVMNKK